MGRRPFSLLFSSKTEELTRATASRVLLKTQQPDSSPSSPNLLRQLPPMHPKRSVDNYRSVHHKRPFIESNLLALLHYLALIAVITLAVIFIRVGEAEVKNSFIAAVIAFAVTWLLCYVRRLNTKCPLCKGTPLLDCAAVKHTKAVRIAPLSYGTTAQISLLFTNRFRCMYCGTGFDLLKKSSIVRGKPGKP